MNVDWNAVIYTAILRIIEEYDFSCCIDQIENERVEEKKISLFIHVCVLMHLTRTIFMLRTRRWAERLYI